MADQMFKVGVSILREAVKDVANARVAVVTGGIGSYSTSPVEYLLKAQQTVRVLGMIPSRRLGDLYAVLMKEYEVLAFALAWGRIEVKNLGKLGEEVELVEKQLRSIQIAEEESE
jgi:DNA-binding FadR family transcriptional regulator